MMRLLFFTLFSLIIALSEAQDCPKSCDNKKDEKLQLPKAKDIKTCADIDATTGAGKSLCLSDQSVAARCACTCQPALKNKKCNDCECKKEEKEEPEPEEPEPEEPDPEDLAPPPSEPPCFDAESTINTSKGIMTMKDLRSEKVGDIDVQTINKENQIEWSPIRIWLHAEETRQTSYLEITTENKKTLSISPNHLMYTLPCDQPGERSSLFARQVNVGDCVLTQSGSKMIANKVENIQTVEKTGAYTFTTESGTIIVNEVAASVYAALRYEDMAHKIFTLLYKVQSVLPYWLSNDTGSALHPLAQMLIDLISIFVH